MEKVAGPTSSPPTSSMRSYSVDSFCLGFSGRVSGLLIDNLELDRGDSSEASLASAAVGEDLIPRAEAIGSTTYRAAAILNAVIAWTRQLQDTP
jgi:hypothetical protein